MTASSVPILIYHALFNQTQKREKYAVHRETFEEQMRYLHENEIVSLSLDDLLAPPMSIYGEKGVVITFDDGNESDYSIAYPILKQYGLTAVFFVIASRIGQPGYVEWDQLEEMAKGGMSIQSHGLTHTYLYDLPEDALHSELHRSREMLAERLQMPVDFFAVPGGVFSKEMLRVAKEVGYRGVCTSVPGLTRIDIARKEFNVWNRFTITGATSLINFKAILHEERHHVAFCKLQYFLKAIVKKIIGESNYYALWSAFFKNRSAR